MILYRLSFISPREHGIQQTYYVTYLFILAVILLLCNLEDTFWDLLSRLGFGPLHNPSPRRPSWLWERVDSRVVGNHWKKKFDWKSIECQLNLARVVTPWWRPWTQRRAFFCSNCPPLIFFFLFFFFMIMPSTYLQSAQSYIIHWA